MDKLKAMQIFIAIADAGSLTGAASSLQSSLPAVVRALAGLESEVGVRLVNRTTRRLALTDDGRQYLMNCRQIVASVTEAEATLGAQAADLRGHLTITAPVLFGQMYIAPAVTRFVQEYPNIQVDVMLFDQVTNLLEEGFDAAIRIGALPDSSLVAQPLGSVRRMVVASPAFLRSNKTPTHPRDLLKANCVRFLGGPGLGWTFHQRGRSFTVPVTGNLAFNHAAPAVQACVEGLGFGLFISYQVGPYIKDKRLKPVLESFEPPPRPIHVVYPHARLLPLRTRVFIDWIKQSLHDLPI